MQTVRCDITESHDESHDTEEDMTEGRGHNPQTDDVTSLYCLCIVSAGSGLLCTIAILDVLVWSLISTVSICLYVYNEFQASSTELYLITWKRKGFNNNSSESQGSQWTGDRILWGERTINMFMFLKIDTIYI